MELPIGKKLFYLKKRNNDMKELKFNSQICTTVEQSKRLLELGLKSETADMCWLNDMQKPFCSPYKCLVERVQDMKWVIFPAWSLHRLIELCPETISFEETYNDEDVHCSLHIDFDKHRNIYNNIIDCIDWLIKGGNFNKEYLKL